MEIIDAHIHLDSYEENTRTEIINSIYKDGLKAIITVSMNLISCKQNLQLSKENKGIYPAFGFHPEQKLPAESEINELFKWIRENNNEMIAIGEVGLPYYLKQDNEVDYVPYLELLERFIILSNELNKPIILHAVYEDADIVCDLLEKHSIKKAHFHWFKGSNQTIKRMIQNGYYISITPDVLYENEIQELVKDYPLHLMMVETDGPWPFEGPFTGDWTHPKFIHDSIQKIAELKKMDIVKVYHQLYENSQFFYGV